MAFVTGTLATPGVLANLDPIANPEWWHYVYVGGIKITTPCELDGFARVNGWDVKKGKGADGATVTTTGRDPAKGKLKFLLWTSQHFTDWSSQYALFQYDPTKKQVQAIDLWHPALASVEINGFVTEEITPPMHVGLGLYTITVSVLEYLPPPPTSAVSTPTKSEGNKGGGPDAPEAADPFKDADANLNEQNQALANQLAGPS